MPEPNELYPADATLNALSGTDDATGVPYPAIGESPYYTTFYRMLYRLLDVARLGDRLRVVKDGELTFGIRPGRYDAGGERRTFGGTEGESLADDAVNTVYLDAAGDVQVATDGLPAAGPVVPLAEIAVGSSSAAGLSGQYGFEDITDLRPLSTFAQVGPRAGRRATVALTRLGRQADLSELPTSADGTSLALSAGTFGTDSPVVRSSSVSGTSITETARVLAALPEGHVAGRPVAVRVRAHMTTDPAVAAQLDLQAYRCDGEGGLASAGADLCTTSPVALTTSWADAEFALTASDLAAGDVLDLALTVTLDDTGGSAGGRAEIGHIALIIETRN